MNLQKRDDELQRLLADDGGEFGRLYRRLPHTEPPRRLDRSVLGEAARGVLGHAPHRHRWLVGLGSFAGLALAAGVAWHIGQNALPPPEPARGRPVVVPVEPISPRPRPQAAERAAPLPPSGESAAAPAPPPAAAKTRTPSRRATPATQPAAAPAAAPAPAPEPPPAAAKAPPSPTPFPAEAPHREAAPATMEAAPAAAPESPKASSAMPSSRGAAPAPSSSLELRRDLQLAPAQWLARIRQLMQEGRRQQASESLRLFRRVHPAQPLPDDLRALLDQADE